MLVTSLPSSSPLSLALVKPDKNFDKNFFPSRREMKVTAMPPIARKLHLGNVGVNQRDSYLKCSGFSLLNWGNNGLRVRIRGPSAATHSFRARGGSVSECLQVANDDNLVVNELRMVDG